MAGWSRNFITDNNGNNVGKQEEFLQMEIQIIGSANPNPYVWNAASGLTYITHPNAFSASKEEQQEFLRMEKVIGYYRAFGAPPMSGEGFIWTSATGRINLNDYAASLGIATNGVNPWGFLWPFHRTERKLPDQGRMLQGR